MSAIYILVGVSMLIAGGFLLAFLWSVRHNQLEDQKGSAIRMLHDNDLKQ